MPQWLHTYQGVAGIPYHTRRCRRGAYQSLGNQKPNPGKELAGLRKSPEPPTYRSSVIDDKLIKTSSFHPSFQIAILSG